MLVEPHRHGFLAAVVARHVRVQELPGSPQAAPSGGQAPSREAPPEVQGALKGIRRAIPSLRGGPDCLEPPQGMVQGYPRSRAAQGVSELTGCEGTAPRVSPPSSGRGGGHTWCPPRMSPIGACQPLPLGSRAQIGEGRRNNRLQPVQDPHHLLKTSRHPGLGPRRIWWTRGILVVMIRPMPGGTGPHRLEA